jgi:hypothetical protein
MLNLNDAERQKNKGPLIPKNTIAPVQMNVRPGGAGEGGWLKRSKDGESMGLDVEFTVIDGEFARRKFWGYFTIESSNQEKHKKAIDISKSNLRAILESARNIDPAAETPEAMAGRKADYSDLDGIRFIAGIGIKESDDPKYDDKNQLSFVVTPGRKEYVALKQAQNPLTSPQNAGITQGSGAKPKMKWA